MHTVFSEHLQLEGSEGARDQGAQVLVAHQHLVVCRGAVPRHPAEQLRKRLQAGWESVKHQQRMEGCAAQKRADACPAKAYRTCCLLAGASSLRSHA